jgi:hypothetical protein
MPFRSRILIALAAVSVLFLHAQRAAADQMPAGWEVKDAGVARKFLDTLRSREKFSREKNLAAYNASLPRFLRAQFANQIKTLGWSDEKVADMLHGRAIPDSELQPADVVGFKQQGLTTALVLRRNTPADPGQTPFMVQLFYLEDSAWKVGERIEFMKPDKSQLGPDLQKIAFYAKLPDAPAAIGAVEVRAIYDIASVANGEKLDWSVNGVSQAPAKLSSASGLLIGGLKRGRNVIRVNVTKASGAPGDVNIEITLRPESKSIEEMQRTKPYLTWHVQTTGVSEKEFDVG